MKAYGKKGAHKELAEISADMTLDEIIDMAEFFEDIRCHEERLRMEGRTCWHYHYRDYLRGNRKEWQEEDSDFIVFPYIKSGEMPARALETDEDARALGDRFNGFHDGVLLSLREDWPNFTNGVHSHRALEDRRLTVRFQVPSMKEIPVVELRFFGVYSYSHNTEAWDHHGPLVIEKVPIGWHFSTDLLDVRAERMDWRLITQDGDHLRFGGSEEGVWYRIHPFGWKSDRRSDFFAIVDRLAEKYRVCGFFTSKNKPSDWGLPDTTERYFPSGKFVEEREYPELCEGYWLTDREKLVYGVDHALMLMFYDENGLAATWEQEGDHVLFHNYGRALSEEDSEALYSRYSFKPFGGRG